MPDDLSGPDEPVEPLDHVDARGAGDVGRSQLRWADSISEAAAAVAQRPIRTLLTALGTILGVGAFITTSGLAQTASAQVSARFDALAATEVRVQDANPDGSNPFPAELDSTLEGLNGVNFAGLTFTVPDTGTIQARNTATRPVGASSQPIPVIAVTPGAVDASLPTLLTGRTYDLWHERRGEHVALLGRVAANQLGITRVDYQPVAFLGDTAYTIVGIIDDVARNPDLLLAIIIPTTAANRQFDTANAERQVIIDTQPGAAQLIGRQAPIALRPDPIRITTYHKHPMPPASPSSGITQQGPPRPTGQEERGGPCANKTSPRCRTHTPATNPAPNQPRPHPCFAQPHPRVSIHDGV